jgi:phosphatidylserine/phosphatidylglycerophosphate/cardiolipin synthase-like enzyme
MLRGIGPQPLYHLDRALGESLERTLRAHHRRRLHKIGWDHAFDPGTGGAWARGASPPRPGNALTVLIDGEEAFGAMAEAVAGAQSRVDVAGWHIEPDFRLAHDGDTLESALADAGRRADVRVLLWAGAPLPPPFRPRRGEAKDVAAQLGRHRGVTCALDSKERLLHCHHEKIVVVDETVAFVGGFDFSRLGASRLDASHHPMKEPMGWHDAAFRIEGPLVADVAAHFGLRWREVTGEALPEPQPPAAAGGVEAQLVRTVPEGVYDGLARGEFTILESYVQALNAARELVYLENQFLWSSEIVKILAEKLRDPPTPGFRLVLVLPAKPTTGNDDTLGQLAVLAEADDGAGRFVASTLYGREGRAAKPVYVHAKVGIVDDRWLTIGSGNLNNHSLFNDSEVNVVTHDPGLARDTRLRLWAEHLEQPVESLGGRSSTEIVDEVWVPTAIEQLERRESGAPVTHRLTRLPHVSKRSKRLLGPLQTFLVDG